MDIRQFCVEFFGIQDRGLLDDLERVCRVRRVPKGDALVQIGEKQSEAAFLISGLFRGYYVDSEGVWDSTKDTPNPPKNKIVK